MTVLRSLFGGGAEILNDRDYQVLLLASLVAPLGTGVLSPILDSLVGPFGTTPAGASLLIAFLTGPAIVMTPIAGVLADRFGRKLVLVTSLILFGVAGVAIAFTTDFRVVLGLRLLQGAAFGGMGPIVITSIGDIYEGTEEATGQGIRFTTSGLSMTIFPLLSGILVVLAWHYPFYLYALAIPIALVVLVVFTEPTATGPTASPLPDGGDRRSALRALLAVLAQRRVYAMVIARGLPMVVLIAFFTYNSFVVTAILDRTPVEAGMLNAVANFVLAVAASQAGRITERFESRLYPLIGANVCLGVGFAVFLLSPSLPLSALGISVVGVGAGLTLSIYRSIITGFAGPSLRGGLVSVGESFGRVCSTVTPIAMGAGISLMTPALGLGMAVQLAGLGAALVGSVGGIVCLLAGTASPPVQLETA